MKKWRILPYLLASCSVGLMIQGCARGHYRTASGTVTPGLTAEDRRHGRNGTNPNAPFTLSSRAQTASVVKDASYPLESAPCAPENLGVVEVAEQVNGDERFVSLAFVNEGTKLCELGGYPTLTLLDERGEAIGSMLVVEAADTSQISAARATASATALPASTAGPIELMLAPQGEAYFGISWVTGAQCPTVSGLAIRAPGIPRAFSINHPLTVCSGRVMVTALRSTQNAAQGSS